MGIKVQLYSMEEVAGICLTAGLTPWESVTAVSIAWAESGGNAYAIGINDQDPTAKAYLSMDVGMWQTNDYWHPEIASKTALTPELQILEVMRISKRTGSWGYVYHVWTAWSTYNAGLHKRFTQQAYWAVKAAGGIL